MNVKLIAIAALGKSRQIGLQGKIPWDLPDEYAHFVRTIKYQYVLIGRKNYELHGKAVTDAFPLVLTRNPLYKAREAQVFHNMPEVITYAEENEVEKIYVMGGAEIYKLALPYVSEFLWTEVDYDGPADSYFPEFLNYPWTQISEEKHGSWTLKKLIK